MGGSRVFMLFRQIVNGTLEPLILERCDLSAALADQVVMVIPAWDDRFEHPHPVAEVGLLDQTQPLERFERTVDTGHADGITFGSQGVVNLLS